MAVAFVIRDGNDHVRIETGVGVITAVEPKGERNVRIVIAAEGLNQPMTSWVDKQGEVWPRVEKASAAPPMRIRYTIEVHRKSRVPAGRLVKDLTNQEKIRDLVAINLPTDPVVARPGQPCTETGELLTVGAPAPGLQAPAQAPTSPAAPPPAPSGPVDPAAKPRWLSALFQAVRRPESLPEQISWLTEQAQAFGATDDELAIALNKTPPPAARTEQTQAGADFATRHVAEATGSMPPGHQGPRSGPLADPSGSGTTVSPQSGLTRRPTSVPNDEKPWSFTNTDGSLNLGSYAASAVQEMVNLAGRLIITRMRERAKEEPDYELRAPTPESIETLASQLLDVVDQVQVYVRGGGRLDRMSQSHKACRQAVREALDLYPVPWGASEEALMDWRRLLAAHAALTLQLVYKFCGFTMRAETTATTG